jgi:SAM-dependent methyltransferase
MKKLNLACGSVILKDWDNLDYESRVDGVIECDLNSNFPYENNSVDEILTSHFLEHLKLRTEAVPFLKECNRVLKPGGILSIIVPDFEMLTKVKKLDYHFNKFRNSKNSLRWLVGATFGEGRTRWDYHVSGWFEERFKELGKGNIIVDPAAGIPIEVWSDMELVKIIKKWRPHSPYEITAIYKKITPPPYLSYLENNTISWFAEKQVVGSGMISPLLYTIKRLPKMFANTFLRGNK